MYRVRVTYGRPVDPEAFSRYYTNTHAPLASRVPGLREFFAGHCESLDGADPEAHYVAELVFANRDDALAGLGSVEGQAAAADVGNFATGGATMTFVDDDIAAR